MIRILGFMSLILFALSCANDLDLVNDFKEVPVVYALIDQADTAQYIRVERVFVDKNTSALEISQRPDSLYYDDITVRLINRRNNVTYTLQKVDGNLEGYARDNGVFAQSPNYLYKIKTTDIALVPGDEIQLSIEGIFPNSEKTVGANAIVLEKPFFVAPLSGGSIAFDPTKKINIGWNPKTEETNIFTATFFINIDETKNGAIVSKKLKWVVEPSTEKNLLDASGRDFYTFLSGQLKEDSEVNRRISSVEFELIAGNKSIADYIRVGKANLGITSSGEIPIYTNINDGLGVFGTTVTDLRVDIDLNQATLDSLRNGSITRNLNFQ